ncbi:MAG: single-stranded-DNA-specific exonuclease RecJ [Gammaproteobacteria bacterium]|nr:single-stranded-DNA-specific exonuclease RecJ [Gammaproteobacteria bacterium]
MSTSRTPRYQFVARPLPPNWSQVQAELGVDPILGRILASRGVVSESDTSLRLSELLPPDGLEGIQNAAARLVHAIQNDELILIAGDFDADGATASALCVLMLRDYGAKRVESVVPDRFRFGYGLSKGFVQSLLVKKPKVIVTVDNGISSNEGVQFARDNGIDTIITDHHLPPEELPAASAIVNPQLSKSSFASTPAGVGVAFYVMVEVRRQLRALNHFEEKQIPEPKVADYLDLVALGTVVDLVPLDRNNRILVANGLNRMRRRRTRPGIIALCEIARVRLEQIDAEDLGYRLGPRLNAAGRLEDISIGIQALLTSNLGDARIHVGRLNEINAERQQMQQEMTEVAHRYLDSLTNLDRPGVCVHDQSFHEGIVGLIASQVVGRLNRPAVVFADAQDGLAEYIKGSARSVANIHIRDVLADIDSQYPNLLISYGGHAMAAGVTIHKASFERFSSLFEKAVAARAASETFSDVLYTDGKLDDEYLTLQLVRSINDWGPWGKDFDPPLFHGSFDIVNQQVVGKGRHLKMVLKQHRKLVDAIAFNHGSIDAERVEVAYRPTGNSFRGSTTLQLVVECVQPETT